MFRVVNAEFECTARNNLGAIDTYEHKKPKRENEGETLGFMTRMKSRLVIKRQRDMRTKETETTRRLEFQALSATIPLSSSFSPSVLYELKTRSPCWAQFILLNSTSVPWNSAKWLHTEIPQAATDFATGKSHEIVYLYMECSKAVFNSLSDALLYPVALEGVTTLYKIINNITKLYDTLQFLERQQFFYS